MRIERIIKKEIKLMKDDSEINYILVVGESEDKVWGFQYNHNRRIDDYPKMWFKELHDWRRLDLVEQGDKEK